MIKRNEWFLKALPILSYLSFVICVFAITRQFPFVKISGLISISLVLIFVFSIIPIWKKISRSKKGIKVLFLINVVSLMLLFMYSVFIQHNSAGLAIRFLIILVLLLVVFFMPRKKFFLDSFIVLAVLHSLFLIGFEIYIVLLADANFATHIRNLVIELGVGDIYTYNGFYYRIQIKGNPILPIAFLISLFSIKTKRLKIIIPLILFGGTMIAGNFAFMLAIIFFFIVYSAIYYRKRIISTFSSLFKQRKRFYIVVSTLVVFLALIGFQTFKYVEETIVRKSEYSLPARFDQVEVLMDNLSESPQTLLLGQGVGNVLSKKTPYRDYTNNIYFELQTFYVLNQVGILYFLLYILTNIVFILFFWRNKITYVLYLSYLVYALTNPYIFDSTHILVILVLNSLEKYLTNEVLVGGKEI
ncbi:hypothetical protein [Neobacillus sp.]|uniref:hypothetical protein n=1 Tax=Neobacillus sp. TaxID=2675273 RepID=UPI00289E4B63|nr:hypothetical protein [Neobacillus sp.]